MAAWLLLGSALPLQAAELLIVGDSLSDAYSIPAESGWVTLLARELGERHEVINASISGETTAGARVRMDDLLARHAPDLVLIILGGNDGLRGLPPAQLQDNLAALIEKGKAAGAEVALMQVRLPASLGPVYIQRFEAVYARLAKEWSISLLPFFLDFISEQPELLLADGIHPGEQAQLLMLEAVRPFLVERLEALD